MPALLAMALDHHRVLMPHLFRPIPHKTNLTGGDTIYVHERFLPMFRKLMGTLEVNDDDDMSCNSGIDRPRLNDKKIQEIFFRPVVEF